MPPRRVLSIRQPYAELILRGIKKIEYRSRPTRIIGERFYIYAAQPARRPRCVFCRNVSAPGHSPFSSRPYRRASGFFPPSSPG